MVRRRALESDGPGARFQLLCVTWERSPNLAGPQFSYLENGNNCLPCRKKERIRQRNVGKEPSRENAQ